MVFWEAPRDVRELIQSQLGDLDPYRNLKLINDVVGVEMTLVSADS